MRGSYSGNTLAFQANAESSILLPRSIVLNMNLTEQLIALAEEIEMSDPIDWGMLSISEHDAYELIAGSVLENYLATDADIRDMMLLATVVKLTVENFALNLKLIQQ